MFDFTYERFQEAIDIITEKIKANTWVYKNYKNVRGIYPIPQGGVPLGIALSERLKIPIVDKSTAQKSINYLIVDDLIDSGRTIQPWKNYPIAVLGFKPSSIASELITYSNYFFNYFRFNNEWVHFWWEKEPEKDIEENIVRILEYIGEDPNREGLVETPKRVVKSWQSLFSGYSQNPEDVLKTFNEDNSDEMILLKDITLHSTCEHHMLPFTGKAHIAYIPDGKVLGVSKLVRLLEIFARRLQIQERICDQVTEALMNHLKPIGAACILEAKHSCMSARGVEQQNSIMVTSSLKGAFLKKASARAELMQMIKS